MKEKFIEYILDKDILNKLSESQKDILYSYLLMGEDFDKLESYFDTIPFNKVISLDSIAKEYNCIGKDGVPDKSEFGVILDRYLLFLSKNAPVIFFRKMVAEGDETLYPYSENLTMRYQNYVMPSLKNYSVPIYDDIENEDNDDTDLDTDDEDMYDVVDISADSDDGYYVDITDCNNLHEFRYGLFLALIDEYGKKEVISCLKSINAGNNIIEYLNSIILEDEIRYGYSDFHEFFINLIVYNKSTDNMVDVALICYLKMNVDADYHSEDAKIYEKKLIPTEEIIDNILSHNIPSVILFKFLFYHRLFGECFGDLIYYNYFYIEDKCFLKLVDRFIDDSDTMYNYAVELLSKDTHKLLDNGEYRREWKYVTLEVYGAFVAAILFKFANLNKKQTDTILSLLDNFFINKARDYYYGADFKYEIYNKNETDILKLTDNFNILKNGEYKPLFRVIEPERGYHYLSKDNAIFDVDHMAILSVAFLWSLYSKTAKNYFIMSSSASSVLKRMSIELPLLSYLFNVYSKPYKMNLYEYLYKELHLEPIELYKISENKSGKERVKYKLEFYDRNMYINEFFAFTQNEPEVVYEILKTKGLSVKEYQYILDETFNKYPEIYEKKYIVNLLYVLSSKDYVHFIPYFTENKEYIEDEVKKVAENETGSAKKLAESLVAWLKDDDDIPSLKEDIILYTKEKYEKSMDKKLPFVKELDYGSVLFKDSGEKVPDYTLKYVVYEYFTYVNPEATKLSLNLYKLVDILSFNKFLNNFYSLWKEQEYPQKYKNMAVLYTIFINKDKLALLQKDIEYLYANSRMAIGKLFISGMTLRNDDYGLSTLDRLNRKSKDKKIRKDILSNLQLVADNLNISLYELYDMILPDFGFNNRREIIFDYRLRKVKVMLNNDFKLILEDKNGKLLKSLPPYSEKQYDNEAMVETAQEEYQYIKKQLPLSIESWDIRLLQATLLNKQYPKNKWIDMFINNPLLNIYATKLIWQSYDSKGDLLNSFRVTEDGYFVTNEDEDINIDNVSYFCLLSPYNSNSEIIDKWREHLEDYEITQPFSQLDLPNNSMQKIDKDLFKDKKYKIKPLKKILEKFGFEEWSDGMGIGYNVFKTITQHNCAVYICFQCNPEDHSDYIFDGANIDVWIDNIIVEQLENGIKPSSYMYKKILKQWENTPQPIFNFIAYMMNYL